MIQTWLNLPEPGLFGALAALFGGTLGLIAWLVFASPLSAAIRSLTGAVAPSFSAVSVLFALLTGFLANDVGQRNQRAAAAVSAERNAAMTLDGLTRNVLSNLADVRGDLHTYLTAVITQEWPMVAAERPSSDAQAAYLALLGRVGDSDVARKSSPAAQGAMLTAAVQLGTARAERLAIATEGTNELKWATVLVLGVLTQLSLALVHLERIRAHLATLTLFSVAAVVALGLIALQENPFAGSIQVSPAPLKHALAALSAS